MIVGSTSHSYDSWTKEVLGQLGQVSSFRVVVPRFVEDMLQGLT